MRVVIDMTLITVICNCIHPFSEWLSLLRVADRLLKMQNAKDRTCH